MPDPRVITFYTSEPLSDAIDEMMRITGLTEAEVFQKAFTLLRIHVEAAQCGRQIKQTLPGHGGQLETLITLPFNVKKL